MRLTLKASEHIRIVNDSGAGFTAYIEGNIVHLTARSPTDPHPGTETVQEPDLTSARTKRKTRAHVQPRRTRNP